MMVARKVAPRSGSFGSTIAGVPGLHSNDGVDLAKTLKKERQTLQDNLDNFMDSFFKAGKRRRSPTGELDNKKKVAGDSTAKDKGYHSNHDDAPSVDTVRSSEAKVGESRLRRCEQPRVATSLSECEGGEFGAERGPGDMNGASQALHEPAVGSEVLLRWGQRKRLRFARSDGKTGGEESEVEGRRRCRSSAAGAESRNSQQLVHVEDSMQRTSSLPPSPRKASAMRRGVDRSSAPGPNTHQQLKRESCNKPKDIRLRCLPPLRGHGALGGGREDGEGMANASDNARPHQSHHGGSCPPDGHPGNGGAQETGFFQERRYIQQCLVSPELVELPKFLLSLSRSEKEDDFLAIKGSKLPQRPRRRAKHVEKSLVRLLPGAWLCNLTRERYEVRERKATKKKPRGLKAMSGGAESDTDE